MMYKAELIKGVIDGVYDKNDVIKYCSTLSDIKPLYAELLCTQQRLINAEEEPFVIWGADAEFSEDESEFAKYIANHAQNPVTEEWEQLNHNYELERVEDAIYVVEELMRKEPHQAKPHQVEPHQVETAPQKPQNKAGRRSRAFNSYLVGTDEEKERTLEKLHRLIDGRQGKEVALFIKVAVQLSLITKPTYTAVQKEFGDIGSKTNFNKYINQVQFTKEEIGGCIFKLQ